MSVFLYMYNIKYKNVMKIGWYNILFMIYITKDLKIAKFQRNFEEMYDNGYLLFLIEFYNNY